MGKHPFDYFPFQKDQGLVGVNGLHFHEKARTKEDMSSYRLVGGRFTRKKNRSFQKTLEGWPKHQEEGDSGWKIAHLINDEGGRYAGDGVTREVKENPASVMWTWKMRKKLDLGKIIKECQNFWLVKFELSASQIQNGKKPETGAHNWILGWLAKINRGRKLMFGGRVGNANYKKVIWLHNHSILANNRCDQHEQEKI